MGNNNSNTSMEKRLPESWLEIFSALKLRKKEMRKLHKVFRNMDLDSDGIVTVGDILSALDIERTKFTERIFAVFDAKHDGRIDFREFVLSLWNYCTLGKASLSKLLAHTCVTITFSFPFRTEVLCTTHALNGFYSHPLI
jgi:hypothetical protein